MDVEAIRSTIPALKRGTYVNTGWSGPSPQPVLDAISGYLQAEADDGPTSAASIVRRVEVDRKSRRLFAQLINAETKELALTANTTEGINIVFNGLTWKEGDRLVITNVEHPGIQVPALFKTRKHKLDLVAVDCSASLSQQGIIDGFDAAITPGTRLVAVSHVSYANGSRLPLREIVEIAHSRGVQVVADGAQTGGHIALDMKALGIDYYSIPGHKWLCGPDGTGALYVRFDRFADLPPAEVGYYATESFTADDFVENVKDARRYQVSTSNGGLWAGVNAGLEMVLGLGTQAVEDRSAHLASYAVGKLMSVPKVRIVSPREGPAVTGLVCFQIEGVEPDAVTGTLWERHNIVARSVEGTASTRLSLAFFNTEADVDRVVEAARDIAERGPIDVEASDWWRAMHSFADEV